MRILLVGAGGVGGAAAAIAARRDFVECLVVADYDLSRAEAVVDRVGDPRLVAVKLDATDETDPVTNDMVIAILRDEEGHRRLFEGFLREYEAEGLA